MYSLNRKHSCTEDSLLVGDIIPRIDTESVNVAMLSALSQKFGCVFHMILYGDIDWPVLKVRQTIHPLVRYFPASLLARRIERKGLKMMPQVVIRRRSELPDHTPA
jgi:hypothetical protein